MDETPLVSVIIPVYNVRPYLEEALDSVVGQTYRNLEVIVIDDGSIDGSGAVCDDYARRDSRMCVVHQQNQGLSAARNAGLDLITGDVVTFLDSDDALDERFVEALVGAMAQTGADVTICRYITQRTTGHLRQSTSDRHLPAIAPDMYGRAEALRAIADGTINVNVWNKLYRRELWSGIRFPSGHVYEDLDTIPRVLVSAIRCA